MGRCLQFQFQSLPGGQRVPGRGGRGCSEPAELRARPVSLHRRLPTTHSPSSFVPESLMLRTCDSPLQRQGRSPFQECILRNLSSLRCHWGHQKRAGGGKRRRRFCRGRLAGPRGQGTPVTALLVSEATVIACVPLLLFPLPVWISGIEGSVV